STSAEFWGRSTGPMTRTGLSILFPDRAALGAEDPHPEVLAPAAWWPTSGKPLPISTGVAAWNDDASLYVTVSFENTDGTGRMEVRRGAGDSRTETVSYQTALSEGSDVVPAFADMDLV